MMQFKYSLNITILVLYVSFCFSTLSKSDKKKKNESKKNDSFNMYDDVQLDYKTDMLKGAKTYSEKLIDIKSFDKGRTLAYITPWNNYGYDIGKRFASKFSFVSPVWLGISYDGSDFQISGLQDIDVRWVSDLKTRNADLKIIPRLIFEHWSRENYIYVMKNKYLTNQLTEKIDRLFNKYNFDGVVLEIWLQIGAYYKTETIDFIHLLSHTLKEKKLILLLAIPPPVYGSNNAGIFNGNDFSQLENYVDYFSLMTYDYSVQDGSPGPNAPIEWMKKCVEILEPNGIPYKRMKILMGLNFYGYKYSYQGNSPIIRHEFMDVLEKSQDVEVLWHRDVKEHEFKLRQKDGSFVSVWYPTLQSLDLRLKLAEKLGVGISIWEVGQGLDYFYDIL